MTDPQQAKSQQTGVAPQRDYARQIVNAVSHDLKNPTRQIKSFLQMLQNHSGNDIDETGRHYLDLVFQAADTLQAKLDALTVLSRASTSDLNTEICEVSELIDDAVNSHRALIDQSEATIDVDASAKVVADRSHLVSVLSELIGNSLKFCDKPASIRIHAKVSGDECLFAVTDSGPGFDARDFTTPFDLFRRFHLDDYEGTGTGLAVLRTLLLRHGASPTIESSPAAGTTVQFALPLA